MKNKILITTLFAGIAFSGCTSAPKTWGDGNYRDVQADNENPYHFQEGLDEFDQKRLLDAVVKELERCPKFSRTSVFMLSSWKNLTSGEIDTVILKDELNQRLTSRGVTVIVQDSRSEIDSEVSYQDGHVARHLAAAKGEQTGVDALIRGSISSKSQNTDDLKTVLYTMNLQEIDLEKSTVLCSPSVSLKKEYRRSRLSL